jgi:recombinational DNA repair protein RecR
MYPHLVVPVHKTLYVSKISMERILHLYLCILDRKLRRKELPLLPMFSEDVKYVNVGFEQNIKTIINKLSNDEELLQAALNFPCFQEYNLAKKIKKSQYVKSLVNIIQISRCFDCSLAYCGESRICIVYNPSDYGEFENYNKLEYYKHTVVMMMKHTNVAIWDEYFFHLITNVDKKSILEKSTEIIINGEKNKELSDFYEHSDEFKRMCLEMKVSRTF